jgi:hypothetical protein
VNTLPMLDEAPAERVARDGLPNATAVLRSPGQPDVALIGDDDAPGSSRPRAPP